MLVINAGSSSVKWAVFADQKKVHDGEIELGTGKVMTDGIVVRQKIKNHKNAGNYLKRVAKESNVSKVCHRMVHGGVKPCVLSEAKIKEISKCVSIVPLHLPINLQYVREFKGLKQYAVFDSYHFRSLDKNEKIIPIPKIIIPKNVRKQVLEVQGFHGIAHYDATNGEKGNVISFHLGSGCSVAATKDGKGIGCSLHQSALDGVVMRTRSGHIDPGLVLYLCEAHGVKKVSQILNHQSGLASFVPGGDMRDILKQKREDVVDYFSYSVAKQAASLLPLLGDVDTLVFTGGIGENAGKIRSGVCKWLSFLGCVIDEKKNMKNEAIISAKNSKIKIKVKRIDEESAMVRILKREKIL